MEDTGKEVENLSFHLLLVKVIQEEVLCFLIMTQTHFSTSDIIFNALNQLRNALSDNQQRLCPFRSLDHKLIAYQIDIIIKCVLNCYYYHRNQTKRKAKEISHLVKDLDASVTT